MSPSSTAGDKGETGGGASAVSPAVPPPPAVGEPDGVGRDPTFDSKKSPKASGLEKLVKPAMVDFIPGILGELSGPVSDWRPGARAKIAKMGIRTNFFSMRISV